MAARDVVHAAAAALLVLIAGSAPALACACCSNEGQRYVETDKRDAYATGLLDELRFASAAHLYTGEADVENIAGIAAKSRDFQLAVTKSEKSWLFDFKEEGGGGTLALALPDRVTKFEVDPRDPHERHAGDRPRPLQGVAPGNGAARDRDVCRRHRRRAEGNPHSAGARQ